jgi:hypothetical protein
MKKIFIVQAGPTSGKSMLKQVLTASERQFIFDTDDLQERVFLAAGLSSKDGWAARRKLTAELKTYIDVLLCRATALELAELSPSQSEILILTKDSGKRLSETLKALPMFESTEIAILVTYRDVIEDVIKLNEGRGYLPFPESLVSKWIAKYKGMPEATVLPTGMFLSDVLHLDVREGQLVNVSLDRVCRKPELTEDEKVKAFTPGWTQKFYGSRWFASELYEVKEALIALRGNDTPSVRLQFWDELLDLIGTLVRFGLTSPAIWKMVLDDSESRQIQGAIRNQYLFGQPLINWHLKQSGRGRPLIEEDQLRKAASEFVV